MPLNYTDVTPIEVPVDTVPLDGHTPRDAKTFEPAPLQGVTADKMPAVTRAGVELAVRVLRIMTGSIVLLVTYLLIMEGVTAYQVHNTYKRNLDSPGYVADSEFRLRLSRFADHLRTLREDAGYKPSSTTEQNTKALLTRLQADPTLVVAPQRQELSACAATPMTPIEIERIDLCVALAKDVLQRSTPNASAPAQAAEKLLAAQASLRDFWLRAAQLILLNLLLPVLTALLGYVFGTQQAAK